MSNGQEFYGKAHNDSDAQVGRRGGTAAIGAGGVEHHAGHFLGHKRNWIYNPRSRTFSEIAPMQSAPDHDEDDTGGGRWYPSLVTLGTGHVLMLSGHPAGDDLRHHNNTPERYQAIAPAHGNIAPPGEYMLWIVTTGGKPCQRAKFVRVGGDMYVITDRSHFSRTEVQALQEGGQRATFYDAFYVILDGFRPEEVTAASSVQIEFRDPQTGAVVPNFQFQPLDQLFEGGPATPGAGQRIVLVFAVVFPNLNAFAPADQERLIDIVARIGAHSAQGRIVLFDKKNPYMRDGQVHWLSMDVRVLQRAAGTTIRARAASMARGRVGLLSALFSLGRWEESDWSLVGIAGTIDAPRLPNEMSA